MVRMVEISGLIPNPEAKMYESWTTPQASSALTFGPSGPTNPMRYCENVLAEADQPSSRSWLTCVSHQHVQCKWYKMPWDLTLGHGGLEQNQWLPQNCAMPSLCRMFKISSSRTGKTTEHPAHILCNWPNVLFPCMSSACSIHSLCVPKPLTPLTTHVLSRTSLAVTTSREEPRGWKRFKTMGTCKVMLMTTWSRKSLTYKGL